VSDDLERGSVKRLDNSVYYSTPDFGGFSASAMLVMNGSATEAAGFSDGIDEWTVALKYNRGPLFVGATYIALNGQDFEKVALDLNQWGIGLSYEIGAFSVGLTYEQGTLNIWGARQPYFENYLLVGTDTPWSAYLTGSYTFGNNVISAAYGQLDTGISGTDPIQNYVLGYQYNLSKRTRLWIEYVGRDAQQPTLNAVSSDPGTFYFGDQNAASIGTRVDF
jgi:predicted porin